MPDPVVWDVVKQVVMPSGLCISEVRYPACTTYDGRKLLLLKRDPRGISVLDPHLLEGDHIVIARFHPTRDGWRLAIATAELYEKLRYVRRI